MISAIFSDEYRSVFGFVTNNTQLIRESLNFYGIKIEEAKRCGQYVENHSICVNWEEESFAFEKFKGEVKEFFDHPGSGYQFVSAPASSPVKR